MFDKILIANRGEIAVRIARTCKERRVSSVAVHSDVDARARHVAMADEAVHLPGVAPSETYLRAEAIIQAAQERGAQAIHPGYGFLSENAAFAEAVRDAGLAWVGPPPEATRLVGDKISARRLAESAGVPIVPGSSDAIEDPEVVAAFGAAHGYPVALKASGGGGGRGLKVVHGPDEIAEALDSARRESLSYFGSAQVFMERYLPAPKHLEVQFLAPNPDEALWLGVRDCSFQRRHQKLVEETPPPRHAGLVAEMGQAAVALSKACGYVNAGTCEFLVDEDGRFYFLEVNARLQVEHTVTEEVLGLDLVACQLQIAAGDPLGFSQSDVEQHMRGHAIECRINAEDPARGFIPTAGRITGYVEPNGLGVRVDSGYGPGDTIPNAYDSLIAKVVAWGNDREEARLRMLRALDEFVIEGVSTTIAAHRILVTDERFVAGTHTTRTIEETGLLGHLAPVEDVTIASQDVLLVQGTAVRLWSPAMAASASAAVHGAPSGGDVVAPMQGTIVKVLVHEGQEVEAGEAIVVLEAMKMETAIAAGRTGRVARIEVQPGETVGAGHLVASVE